MNDSPPPAAQLLRDLFLASPRRSLKQSSYFLAYADLLEKYRGQAITLVEVGVHHGGSLFVWREFLGPQARIIGIDINPFCRELEKDGFEIFIGRQEDPEFWADFFAQVGPIDVLLDDGGHTSKDQLTTLFAGLDNIRDGGTLIVEDLLGSYQARYGNPSRFSFMNRAKRAIDDIQTRNPERGEPWHALASTVYSVAFFPALVAFHIDRRKCFTCERVLNGGRLIKEIETQETHVGGSTKKAGAFLGRWPWLKAAILRGYFWGQDFRTGLKCRIENWRLGHFFR